MALKPCKLRPKSKGITKYTHTQTKADRKPEGPSRDHLYNNMRRSRTHTREDMNVYFIYENPNLQNKFSVLDGLEEGPYYFDFDYDCNLRSPNQIYVNNNYINDFVNVKKQR